MCILPSIKNIWCFDYFEVCGLNATSWTVFLYVFTYPSSTQSKILISHLQSQTPNKRHSKRCKPVIVMSLLRWIVLSPARVSARRITPTPAVASPIWFSTTAKDQKGPVEATKETLKKADRVVANVAIKGLDTGGSCDVFLLPIIRRRMMITKARTTSFMRLTSL